jgi:hypothetical protein
MAKLGLTILEVLRTQRIEHAIKVAAIDLEIAKLEKQLQTADAAELRANDNRLRIEMGMETL